MRYCVVLILDLLFFDALWAQDFSNVIKTDQSPRGDIEVVYNGNGYRFGMDVWLVDRKDTTQMFRLDSAITLGTQYFFSPNEGWIAANVEIVSNARTILLYKRVQGIRYSRVDDGDIYRKADSSFATSERFDRAPVFGHSAVTFVRWMPESKSFLLRLEGWDDDGIAVNNWTCFFNVETLSVSADEKNEGKVILEGRPIIPRRKKR